ncbi:hypothetical protein [Fontimonas sp. SYSU GA230001]|uniref:hypothetical protein n=1 Tax=Fontimonas sp. SYSU GA230001 TaxID=3142450 RepID=UPI0032B4B350
MPLSAYGAPSCGDLQHFSPSRLLATIEPAASTERLSQGVGCYEDGDLGCDWETTITHDQPIGPHRRLLVANANHLTGTGSIDHLIVFACVSGDLRIVLAEAYLYGVRLEQVSETSIVLSTGQWKPGDASCCPGASRRVRHVWDQDAQVYRKTEQTPADTEATR